MELQRGLCSLCSETTKVLPSADTAEFAQQLPIILYENFLSEPQFQKIKAQIKICAICCYKIQLAVETHTLLTNGKENQIMSEDACHFCKTDKCLMKVERHWKYFVDRAQGFLDPFDLPVCACPKCLFHFDTIFNFKMKLLNRFPQLGSQRKKSNGTPQKPAPLQKETDTPKRKSISKSPPGSKKRKIFDNCFTYLQPLCNNTYYVGDELKLDKMLYNKIAYVNLANSKDIEFKDTPKVRPVIKIKLKRKSKRVDKDSGKLKLIRSEEVPKIERHKTKRRYSLVDKRESSEEPEEKLDETPKSASVSNLVPKRRVSAYMDNGENDEKNEMAEEERSEESVENEIETKEASEEVSQESVDVEEKPPSSIESQETVEVHENEEIGKNGIDEKNDEVSTTDSTLNTTDDVVNGEVLDTGIVDDDGENEKEHEPKEENKCDFSESSSGSPRKSPSQSGQSSEGSDSDNCDHKGTDNVESDVLNGSERKKKRVTFSDEVNN